MDIKRLRFIIIAMIVLMPMSAFADTLIQLKTDNLSKPFTANYTLLSAVTSTGAGTAIYFSARTAHIPLSKHMCTATWSGTTPTSITFAVEGSNDAVNYGALATVTMTYSPYIFHINKPSIPSILGNYQSKVGGDETTALTVTCTSGGF